MTHPMPNTEEDSELRPIPMVNGLDCPACGHPTLILGNGGYITCSLEGCPNPDYAEALEAYQHRQTVAAEDRALDYARKFVGLFKAWPEQVGYVMTNLDGDHYRKHKNTKITLRKSAQLNKEHAEEDV